MVSAIFLIAGCAAKEDYASSASRAVDSDFSASPSVAQPAANSNPSFMRDGASTEELPLAVHLTSKREPAQTTRVSPLVVEDRRQIIRNGDLSVRVKEIEPAERQIERLVASERGYVDSASSTDLASDHPVMKVTLRVPASQFQFTLTTIESMGVRLSKAINSQDVTGQLIDLSARLTTTQDEEKTYQHLLARSNDLQTAMQLRDKLTELRSQIESIAGQRKSMADLASLSTITVTLTQSAATAAPAQDATWLQETWGSSNSFALAIARILGVLAVWTVTMSPFWLPLVVIGRKLVVKARASGATTSAGASTIL